MAKQKESPEDLSFPVRIALLASGMFSVFQYFWFLDGCTGSVSGYNKITPLCIAGEVICASDFLILGLITFMAWLNADWLRPRHRVCALLLLYSFGRLVLIELMAHIQVIPQVRG